MNHIQLRHFHLVLVILSKLKLVLETNNGSNVSIPQRSLSQESA